MKMQEERIEHFDIAKGIAIILVILGHRFVFSIYGLGDNSAYLFLYQEYFQKKLLDTKSYWLKKIKQLILPLFLIPLLLNLYYNSMNEFIFCTSHAGY